MSGRLIFLIIRIMMTLEDTRAQLHIIVMFLSYMGGSLYYLTLHVIRFTWESFVGARKSNLFCNHAHVALCNAFISFEFYLVEVNRFRQTYSWFDFMNLGRYE